MKTSKKKSSKKTAVKASVEKGEFWIKTSFDDVAVKKLLSEHGLAKPAKNLSVKFSGLILKNDPGTAMIILKDSVASVELSLFINQSLTGTEELIKDAQSLAEAKWPGLSIRTKISDKDANSLLYKKALKRAGWVEKASGKGISTLESRPAKQLKKG